MKRKQNFLFAKAHLLLLLAGFIPACQPELEENVQVYANDFEAEELTGITGGMVSDFNGSKVLGNYHQEGFTLHLNDLGEHNYVSITFDLYIHDSWDGNAVGVDGPDTWHMELDEWVYLEEKEARLLRFETSFSNSVCVPGYCFTQAYPEQLPQFKNPKTGAANVNLPGFCSRAGEPQGSSLYRIEKIFRHSASGLALKVYDQLQQSNAADPKCDESWSLDNLSVRTLLVK